VHVNYVKNEKKYVCSNDYFVVLFTNGDKAKKNCEVYCKVAFAHRGLTHDGF
jgi:hypothetical protein